MAHAPARPATVAPEEPAADKNVATGRALDPRRSTRTTARDTAELHGPITPGPCCLRVGADGDGASTDRHRLVVGFRLPVWAVAKSGSPVGVVRNKAGVVTHPGGCRNAATVFTRSRPGADGTAIGRAVGTAAVCAIAAPRAGAPTV
ncbi:hypothetical protein [Streptomyces sp. NPDC002540]